MRSRLFLGAIAVGVAAVGFGLWPVFNGTQTFSERLLDGSAVVWDAAERVWDEVTEGAVASSWKETGEAWWAWLRAPASSDRPAPSRAGPARGRSSGRSSAVSPTPMAPEPAGGDATAARVERLNQAQRRLGGDTVQSFRLDVPAGAQDRAGLDQRLRNIDTSRP